MMLRFVLSRQILFTAALVFTTGIVLSARAQTAEQPGKSESLEAVKQYQAQLERSPEKADLWRKLGIAYYGANRLDDALEALNKANSLNPNDATSVVYRGMIYEQKGDLDQAKTLYQTFLGFKKGDRLTQEVRYRLRWIEDHQLQQIVKDALENEKNVNVAEIPKNSVAVIRFDGATLSPQLKPIGRGLAELIYADLSHVPDLKLVERLELSRLQEELNWSQSELADKLTAPRVGRIVGAAKIVTGQVTETEAGGIIIDCSIVDVGPSLAEYPGKQEGKISELFSMQKQLSLSIIGKLGYEITARVKNQIAKSPTESFLALLAYSRGLDYADQGLYPLAEAEFKAAVAEDPNFSLAQQSLEAYSGLSNYDGNLRPITQVRGLASSEEVITERKEGNKGDIILRLQEVTRGVVPPGDVPFTTPQTSRGKVVVTGTTERQR